MTISDRIKYIRGNLTQKEFAEKTGVSLGGVQNWEVRNQVPNGNALISIRDKFNIDINWLLTGEGRPHPNAVYPKGTDIPAPTDDLSAVELDHFAVIKNFKDKPYARDLSVNLAELERLSLETYRKVGSYIKGVVDGVRMMADIKQPAPDNKADNQQNRTGEAEQWNGEERREWERRQDRPGEPYSGVERRSGQDRRKTGT